MPRARILAATVVAAAIAVAAAVVPARGADEARTAAPRRAASLPMGGIGGFTPASADPRLAAVLARAVTVAVRARTVRGAAGERVAAASTPAALTPIAYDLGVAVGWKRLALSGELARVDLAGQPGGRESADLGVSYTGRGFSGRVRAEAVRPAGNVPRLVQDPESYAVDLGGAYRITRNIDVTAGVRYRSDRERLPQLTDDRRDSQSVYVGTAFRF